MANSNKYSQLKGYINSLIKNNPVSKIRGGVMQHAIEGALEMVVDFGHIRFPKGTLTTDDIGKLVCNQEGIASLPIIDGRTLSKPGVPRWPYLGQVIDVDGSDVIIGGAKKFMATLSHDSEDMLVQNK